MPYSKPKRPEWLQWTVTIIAFILFFMLVVSDFKHKVQTEHDAAAYRNCLKEGCPKAKE